MSVCAMRVLTRILTTSRASLRHGTPRRLSSSIASRHRHDLSTACFFPFFALSFFPQVSIHCVIIFQVLSPSVVLYYCCHPYIECPPHPHSFHCSFFLLLCSSMYTHNLVFISFYLSILATHTGQLVAHLTSCFGSIIITSLSVYRPLYSRLTLTRTCTTCTHIHISPLILSLVSNLI